MPNPDGKYFPPEPDYSVVLIREEIQLTCNVTQTTSCFKILETFSSLEHARDYQKNHPDNSTIIIPTY